MSGEVTDCVPTCVAIVAVRYDRVLSRRSCALWLTEKLFTEPSRTREVLLLLWGIGATQETPTQRDVISGRDMMLSGMICLKYWLHVHVFLQEAWQVEALSQAHKLRDCLFLLLQRLAPTHAGASRQGTPGCRPYISPHMQLTTEVEANDDATASSHVSTLSSTILSSPAAASAALGITITSIDNTTSTSKTVAAAAAVPEPLPPSAPASPTTASSNPAQVVVETGGQIRIAPGGVLSIGGSSTGDATASS